MIFTEQVLYSKTGYKNMFTENNRLIIGRLPREMCKTDVPLLCMETSYLLLRRFLRSLASKILGLDFTEHYSVKSCFQLTVTTLVGPGDAPPF